jgi:uncharacterized protein (TIGR03437 family)
VDTVVFDFRGNTGGDSNIFAPVALAVVGRFPTLLANPNFRFYDAIDKGTFSSGMDDADAFKQPVPPGYGISFDLASVTTVVGEPTGGKPEHYGEVQGFTLPGSQLNGQYSTRFFSQPDGIPPGLSFAPDITINTRSTDYFARYDPVMGAILARSRGAPAAPSGDVITLNAASLRPEQGVAAESLAAARGAFAQVPDQVIVSGQLAPIVNATISRVDFIVPELAAGPAAISALADGVELAAGQFTISAAGPGIFVRDAADPAQPGMIANEDQSANGSANPAGAGSVIHITATGYGPLDAGGNAPVAVYFGDTPARVAGSGPVADSPGIWQIDVQVPVGVSGQVPLYIVTGDLASNAVTVWVN